jgi:hypothetical protein
MSSSITVPVAPVVLDNIHPWLRTLDVAFVPSTSTPLLDEVLSGVCRAFELRGHSVQGRPTGKTDVIFTTAPFGQPISWRDSLILLARRKYHLRRTPTVFTFLHARPEQWEELVDHFERALVKEPPDLADYKFPGLAPTAYRTLIEQGTRGGPILAIERVLQSQAMCLRLVVIVGDDRPLYAYHFDLVGSIARADAATEAFYDDIVLRATTAVSAQDIGPSEVVPPRIPHSKWASLSAPPAMCRASTELGHRNFFTEMVRIADLVHVPAVSDAIADQYSEGCFSTWEPALPALITTITGSARPVDKGNVTDDELAVLVGTKPETHAVFVRHVEGKRNDRPSSEAYEMADMDNALQHISLGPEWGIADPVPVVRSKLHGHRGVSAYDPRYVEYIPIGSTYFRYPVTCGTQQQAEGIKAAFELSETLRNPADPRQIAFTLLPTHGVFIVEKWVPGKAPFQAIWECMDAGYLRIVSQVPQGPQVFTPQRLE